MVASAHTQRSGIVLSILMADCRRTSTQATADRQMKMAPLPPATASPTAGCIV